MFLELAHTKLDVFHICRKFTLECYRVTKEFPNDEKFAMTSQIRRAALSAYLNIAEGCSRKSLPERKRYYEISRGSLIEVDAALDIAVELHYCNKQQLQELGSLMINLFKLTSGLIGQG